MKYLKAVYVRIFLKIYVLSASNMDHLLTCIDDGKPYHYFLPKKCIIFRGRKFLPRLDQSYFLHLFVNDFFSIPGSLFFLFSFVLPSSMAHFYLCAHVLSNFLCALLLFFNLAIGVVMHCWSYYQSYAGRWVCLFLVLWLSLCSQAHGFASKITKVLQDYLMAH
jgi:hypothetical protein